MKTFIATFLVGAALTLSAPAQAANTLLLDPEDLSNLADINIVGDLNRLVIEQTFTGGGAGNSMSVSITGNNNGGPSGSSFSGVAAQSGLTPGHLVQNGFGNVMTVSVTGDDNLFAFSQMGNNNAIHATVVGMANEAAVSQVGNGNLAYFSQNGVGNSVNITQIAR